MPKVTESARVTTREGVLWRECAGCGALVAMASESDRCDACQIRADARPDPREAGRSR